VDNHPAGAFPAAAWGLLAAYFVTFTQQPTSFCRQTGKTPKKAALAAVFALPWAKAKGLNFS